MPCAPKRRRQSLRDGLALCHQEDLERSHPSTYAFRAATHKCNMPVSYTTNLPEPRRIVDDVSTRDSDSAMSITHLTGAARSRVLPQNSFLRERSHCRPRGACIVCQLVRAGAARRVAVCLRGSCSELVVARIAPLVTRATPTSSGLAV